MEALFDLVVYTTDLLFLAFRRLPFISGSERSKNYEIDTLCENTITKSHSVLSRDSAKKPVLQTLSLNSGPYVDQTDCHDLNTKLVLYSDPHRIIQLLLSIFQLISFGGLFKQVHIS